MDSSWTAWHCKWRTAVMIMTVKIRSIFKIFVAAVAPHHHHHNHQFPHGLLARGNLTILYMWICDGLHHTVCYIHISLIPSKVWRSGERRRRTPDLQTTTTLGQYTTLLWPQSYAPEDGQDCPKHVELIQRSRKLLLLHLFGHLYYSPTLMMNGQTQIKYPAVKGKQSRYRPGVAQRVPGS